MCDICVPACVTPAAVKLMDLVVAAAAVTKQREHVSVSKLLLAPQAAVFDS
jgi:hypothetical protein